MNRRDFFQLTALGAVSALGMSRPHPVFAGPSLCYDEGPQLKLLKQSFKAAQLAGRPVLVFPMAAEDAAEELLIDSNYMMSVLARLLNRSDIDRLAMLSMVEVVAVPCALLPEVTGLARDATPLLVMVEPTDGPGRSTVLCAGWPAEMASTEGAPGPEAPRPLPPTRQEAVELRLDYVLQQLSSALVSPEPVLEKRASDVRKHLQPKLLAEIDECLALKREPTPRLFHQGAALFLLASHHVDDAIGQRWREGLALTAFQRLLVKSPIGTRWSLSTVCGGAGVTHDAAINHDKLPKSLGFVIPSEPEEHEKNLLIACGMGGSSPEGRRFLFAYSEVCRPPVPSHDSGRTRK